MQILVGIWVIGDLCDSLCYHFDNFVVLCLCEIKIIMLTLI